jgi:hypothetical protein
MNLDKLHKALKVFATKGSVNGKGPLSVVLVITRAASKLAPPTPQRISFLPKEGRLQA